LEQAESLGGASVTRYAQFQYSPLIRVERQGQMKLLPAKDVGGRQSSAGMVTYL
jgi:hypothetical protein